MMTASCSTPARVSFLVVALLSIAVSMTDCTRKKAEPANTIHIPIGAKIKGLDPIQADDEYAGTEVSHAYEGLLQYHYLKRPYTLIPNLAEAMPEVSKDGKTYVFKIKKGVLFQDDRCFKATGGKGRELVADDFIYSFKRLADPALTSSGWWVLDGRIEGLNEWHDEASILGKADYSRALSGLKALDRYTLQIRLNHPLPVFLYMLAMPFTYVVPHEAVETYGQEFMNHPVGTGPYRLTEYNPNQRLVWDRNPTYRKELYPSDGAPGDKEAGLLRDAGKPLPLNDRLVDTVYEEQQPMWLNFLDGKLEIAGIPKDSYAQAVTQGKELSPELKRKGILLTTRPLVDTVHLTFNMADPLMGKNKFLRQAMSTAYNAALFIDTFYNGRAVEAKGPIPPGISGYDPDLVNPYRRYNLAKAKELLAKAGYPGGEGLPPLEYQTLSDSTSRQWTELDQRIFAALGIHLKISTNSWPEFMAKVKGRRGQLWSFDWSADYPDGENFLQLFYSKNASPGSNDSNYSNPAFDRLYERSLSLPDGPGRAALYRRMVGILVEDCPWIFVAHRLGYTLSQAWLRNYKPSAFEHSMAKYWRVSRLAGK